MVNPHKKRLPPPSPSTLIAASVGAGLLLGVAAAYAAESRADARPEADSGAAPATLAAIDSSIEVVARRLERLRDRVAARPESRSSPEWNALQTRLDDLARATESVVPLVKGVDTLDKRAGVVDKEVADLRDQVVALKAKIGKAAQR